MVDKVPNCGQPFRQNLSKVQMHFVPGRPLAEPPVCDYDDFIDKCTYTDIQMKLLWPHDPKARFKFRDISDENAVLGMYKRSIESMLKFAGSDPSAHEFFDGLFEEVNRDYGEISKEHDVVRETIPWGTSEAWEFLHIDKDGGTSELEAEIHHDIDVFRNYPDEVMRKMVKKYAHIFPAGYIEDLPRMRMVKRGKTYLIGNDGKRLEKMPAGP